MKGVRVKLPVFPFEDEQYRANGEYSFHNCAIEEDGKDLDFLLAYPKEKLYKVDYVSNQIDVRLFIIGATGNQLRWDFKPETIGRYKNLEWAFQREWRYKLFIVPKELGDLEQLKFASQKAAFEEVERIFSRTKGLIWYHDMKLRESVLDELEILTGPLCDDAEFEIIDTLTQRYARNAKKVRSKIKLRK